MTVKLVDYLPTIESDIVGVDIETTWQNKKRDTADPFTDRIISIQVSDGNDVWILQNNFTTVIPLLTDKNRKKIIHNAIFDCQFLNYQLGIRTRNIWDSLIIERVIHTGEVGIGNDLASTLARRLGVILNKETRSQFANHTGPMTSEQINYAAEDVIHLIKLRESQLKDVSDMQLGKVVALENAFTPVLVKASLRGVGFDHILWEKQQKQITQRTKQAEKAITDLLGLGYQYDIFGDTVLDINLNSTDQLKRVIYDKFGENLDSTKASVLEDLKDHPNKSLAQFVDMLLDYREWQKRSTWKYDEHVHPITGRIHCSWNQVQASTGRMSCDNPNLQNVPNPLKGKPDDPNFRLLFPPESVTEEDQEMMEWGYIVSDFAQQEPGILAHITQDQELIDAYNTGDVYTAKGKGVYKKEEISKFERYMLKQGMLSAYYGVGIPALAARMGISHKEAEEFRNAVRNPGSNVMKWINSQEGLLKKRGFTLSLSGRRHNFPQIKNGGYSDKSYYNVSINYPIQGTAADMFKLGAVYFDQAAEEGGYEAESDIFIHDEIVVIDKQDEMDEVYYQVISAMEKAASDLCPSVHIKADAHKSLRWSKD